MLTPDQKQHIAVAAATSAGRVTAVAIPEHVQKITLIPDLDAAGEHSWKKLQDKYIDSPITLSRILCQLKDPNKELLALGPDALKTTLAPLIKDIATSQAAKQDLEHQQQSKAAEHTLIQLEKEIKKLTENAKEKGIHYLDHSDYPALRARLDQLLTNPALKRPTLN